MIGQTMTGQPVIGQATNEALQRWNSMAAEAAAAKVLPCCGSWAWAWKMTERRPMEDEAEVLQASEAVWWGLDERDWKEAFATHPRIGERHPERAATEQSLAWSSREQSAVALEEDRIARLLAEGNRAYEARFGRTFLVFASGKSGQEILDTLGARMKNEKATEMREAAEQQMLITRLRLQRWMGTE